MKRDLILFDDIGELLTLQGVAAKSGRHVEEKDLGLLKKAAILVRAGRIVWTGSQAKLPKAQVKRIQKKVSLQGATVLPGFVESHTHLVFAGDRSNEFEMRNRGVSYQEIAAQGGGILSTMRATRKTSLQGLQALAQERVDRFVAQGVTTLEAKSGYALNEKDEFKTLAVHGKLKGPRIFSTFLGAHALPPEFKTAAEYLGFLEALLPKIHKKKLASRVDIFIEKGFFEATSSRRFLESAKRLGFDLAIHADQLSLSGGTDLAIDLGAKSADHVICVEEKQIRRLAKSEVTAVLLPAADLYMKCAYPPARAMIESGVRVALATDFNPGSSPTQELSLVGLLARLQMKMTLPEVIAGLTYNAACALGLQNEIGSLSEGKDADFVMIDGDWRQLFYSIGRHPVRQVYRGGRRIF